MKNIHVIPTDKPSTLFKDDFGKLIYSINIDQEQNHFEPQHIYITSDEEIKEGDWVFNFEYDYIVQYDCKKHDDKFWYKKIILTTDQGLIKDGVQAIDDEFLQWFVKNPSCEEVEIQDWYSIYLSCCRSKEECYCNKKRLIIPKEKPKFGDSFENLANVMSTANFMFGVKQEPKQETLEEAASRLLYNKYPYHPPQDSGYWKDMFKEGAKWQQERMYSEEEVEQIAKDAYAMGRNSILIGVFNKWFEQFKK